MSTTFTEEEKALAKKMEKFWNDNIAIVLLLVQELDKRFPAIEKHARDSLIAQTAVFVHLIRSPINPFDPLKIIEVFNLSIVSQVK